MPPVKLRLPSIPPPPAPRREFLFRDPAAPPDSPSQEQEKEWGDRVALMLATVLGGILRNTHFLISAGAHLLLLISLAALMFQAQARPQTLAIDALIGDPQGPAENFQIVGDNPAFQVDAAKPDNREPLLGGAVDSININPVGLGNVLTGPGKANAGDGEGNGDAEINIGFFGTAAEGTSFVYIVDSSGSMTENGRWGRAIGELSRSIGKLKPHQKFYVYYFSDQTRPLFDPKPAAGLVDATPALKMRAQRWVRNPNYRPRGLTNPELALEQALAMQPDVIFLMTDGEFDDPELLVKRIAKLNTHGTVIHTIALQNEAGRDCLETIAKQNKGTFRFVK